MKKLIYIITTLIIFCLGYNFGLHNDSKYVEGRLYGEKFGYGMGVLDTLHECAEKNCHWIQDCECN